MAVEYDYIETITDFRKTEHGQAGILETEKAKKKLNDLAKEGWRVHTMFQDNRGTCLMVREVIEEKLNPEMEVLKAKLILLEEKMNQPKRKWWQL